MLELSTKLGIPLIAGTDTHSSSKYKAECRTILMIRKMGKKQVDQYDHESGIDLSWKTRDELEAMFDQQGALPKDAYMQAIENTNRLADSVEDFKLDTTIKYPLLYGDAETDSKKLDELIASKLEEKLTSGVIPMSQKEAFEEAIKEEVRVFRKVGMDGFMLSMSEILSWCRDQGMAIGPARGSVGGSRVAYVTDVIDLNPETWGTVFSRFCNEDRVEIGDIDVDVVESDRPAIFSYIINRFGKEYTARVGSYGTIAEAGCIDDIGGALRTIWEQAHPDAGKNDNPWSHKQIDKIKAEYNADQESAKRKYPELFYYFDGMLGTRVSQSVHPAGIVIAPVNLIQEYGVFVKGDDLCMCLDMEEVHEIGLAKYDFLVLKTVQVIRDACNLIGIPYPRSHEINWNDDDVWDDMLRSPGAIFQMEGQYAFDCLKKFVPRNIFDMSLVTACIRPSGASYRDQLLARKPHHNPSPIIDDLLAENLGYLIYQEDTIKFLQQICGLSGSESDNIRRAIGRKQKDRLDKAMPSILEGYCSKSPKPRAEAEEEAREFLQIIEDSASYQFGYNHSIAYCMLGYICAYLRFYYPGEFITAFLNCAANDEDIKNGTMLAKKYGLSIDPPTFGISTDQYAYSAENKSIAKGLSSIKSIGVGVARRIHDVSKACEYKTFTDVLSAMILEADVHSDQILTLVYIDFFRRFGNQRELERIFEVFEFFKRGDAKKINKAKVANSPFEQIIRENSSSLTKSGKEAVAYTLHNPFEIIKMCERKILSMNMPDYSVLSKVKHFADAMGYSGYVSGREEDRRTLYVRDVFQLKRKKDGKQFGYSVLTQSIGSGIESRFTVFNRVYDLDPVKKGDVIICTGYTKEGQYFTMTGYKKVYDEYDLEENAS